ncbi:MAG: diacylglycerol kinase family lipid kinase [Herpetosiphonaceae bacterium]|nr:diacylglycerol kinase family lipid kinase [Herpetosiphonaceae bacterium]
MKRVLVILNPQAGNSHQRRAVAEGMVEWRTRLGWQVRFRETRCAGDATAIARAEAERYDLIVAAGGDGTINEVANGLAHTATTLGALPIGTGNVWVRELRQSLNPLIAARQLAQGSIHQIDLGMANERYFLLMAGIGFDAAITQAVASADKRRLGRLAYIVKSLPVLWRLRGTRTRITLDGVPLKDNTLFVLVSNSRLYGGVLNIAYRASITDGLLDVCVLTGDSALAAPWLLAGILLRGYGTVPGLQYFQARTIEVACSRSLPVQVDGDAIGNTPMTFQIAPAALRVLLPSTVRPASLLEPPGERWWRRP